MITEPSKALPYPKIHLLAASGVATFLSLSILALPSNNVEAKRTFMSPDLESQAQQLTQDKDTFNAQQATNTTAESPFVQIESTHEETQHQPTKVANKSHIHREVIVANGDTLSTLFEKVGLPASTVNEVLASNKQARQFTQLKPNQNLEFEIGINGQLKRLQSNVSDLERITLTKSTEGFAFNRITTKLVMRSAYAHGVINNSLSQSAARAGLSHSVIMGMANLFGYDIDFAQDTRKGDEFDVIYEHKFANGKVVGTGSIIAARLTNSGKTYTAVRYTNKQGISSYYTADGDSIRKAFIRTPVDFARISSRFSMGRKHPILNKIRAHKGVDYAAPRGTPIKATGDGKVLLAGRRSGYGNTVIIQHGTAYRTLYGHMQGFAKGVQTGSNVKQNQVIGYIGTTGLSTGPHVHYEFQVNGVQVDPLGQRLPMSDPIAKTERGRFLKQSQPLMARMNQERSTLLASEKY